MMTGIGMPTAQSRMPRMFVVSGRELGPWRTNGATALAVPA
jgi:hypothetical protein